jgi:hypothetical protein
MTPPDEIFNYAIPMPQRNYPTRVMNVPGSLGIAGDRTEPLIQLKRFVLPGARPKFIGVVGAEIGNLWSGQFFFSSAGPKDRKTEACASDAKRWFRTH